MTEAKPARRRIVPEQLFSPAKATSSQTGADSLQSPGGQQVELGDFKEHSTRVATLLGPQRKIYVDIAAYQREGNAVDWKNVRSGLVFPEECAQNRLVSTLSTLSARELTLHHHHYCSCSRSGASRRLDVWRLQQNEPRPTMEGLLHVFLVPGWKLQPIRWLRSFSVLNALLAWYVSAWLAELLSVF